MKIYKYFILLILIIFLPTAAMAANHYVRAGANGNGGGTDWTNAYNTLPSSLVRGDTYYIADGNYGSYRFDDAMSGETFITIKKATSSDHGTNIGWNATYGDGQAIFSSSGTPISMYASYMIIDGQVGSGKNGHGFVFQCTSGGANTRGLTFGSSTGITDVILRHVEISNTITHTTTDCEVIYANNAADNVTIQYCYLHDCNYSAVIQTLNNDNWIIEHSVLANAWSKEMWSDHDSTNITVRYCTVENFRGTGGFIFEGVSNFNCYGNVFFNSDSSYDSYGVDTAIIGTWYGKSEVGTNWRIYNNTFVNFQSTSMTAYRIGPEVGTGNVCYNNIFFNINGGVSFGSITHDYNAFSGDNGVSESHAQTRLSADIFRDFNRNDFTLVTNTDAGISLPAPYNRDINNNIRGADAIWDRGAYEYSSGLAQTAPAIPDAPSGLRIIQ